MTTLTHRNDAKTVYDDLGDSSARIALLLLHGIGANRRMWNFQIQPFAAAGYRILVPDLFGHGESSKLGGVGFDSWHQQICDLLDHCNLERVVVIGVSMGGVIAQSLVTQHPSRFSHFIVADTFCELKTLTDKMAVNAQLWAFRAAQVLGRRWLSKVVAHAYRAPFARETGAYLAQCTLENSLNQLILARKTINQADFRAALASIQVPSLIMVGTELGTAFVQTNRIIAQAIPKSRFETIEASMDPSNLVNPPGFNRLVLDFLSR